MRTYDGILTEWFETGTEGIVWCLQSDTRDEERLLYGELVILAEGMPITIWDEQGAVLFEGQIQEDSDAGWQPSPYQIRLYGREWLNPIDFLRFLLRRAAMQPTLMWWIDPKAHEPLWEHFPQWLRMWLRPSMHGQASALGFWIHWTQQGWSADKWASQFLRKKDEAKIRARVLVGETLTSSERELLRNAISMREYSMVILRALKRMKGPTALIIGGDEHDEDELNSSHVQYAQAVGQLMMTGTDVMNISRVGTTWVRDSMAELSGIHPDILRRLRRVFKTKERNTSDLRLFLRWAWNKNHLKQYYREPRQTAEELYWELFEILVFSGKFDRLYLLPDSSPASVQLAARARAKGLEISHFTPRP